MARCAPEDVDGQGRLSMPEESAVAPGPREPVPSIRDDLQQGIRVRSHGTAADVPGLPALADRALQDRGTLRGGGSRLRIGPRHPTAAGAIPARARVSRHRRRSLRMGARHRSIADRGHASHVHPGPGTGGVEHRRHRRRRGASVQCPSPDSARRAPLRAGTGLRARAPGRAGGRKYAVLRWRHRRRDAAVLYALDRGSSGLSGSCLRCVAPEFNDGDRFAAPHAPATPRHVPLLGLRGHPGRGTAV